jgi:hypothetical protein
MFVGLYDVAPCERGDVVSIDDERDAMRTAMRALTDAFGAAAAAAVAAGVTQGDADRLIDVSVLSVSLNVSNSKLPHTATRATSRRAARCAHARTLSAGCRGALLCVTACVHLRDACVM